MKPSLIIFSAWLLFAGSHLLLSGSPLRPALVKAVGTRGFTILFAGTTAITILALFAAVLLYGHQGAPGFDIADHEAVRWGLYATCMAGGALTMAGLINYPRSAVAVLARMQRETPQNRSFTLPAPSIVENVTRHPFFVGLCIMMISHAFLAETFATATYFLGFSVLAIVGIPLQDRKLRKRWNESYASYQEKTSNVPFMAWSASERIEITSHLQRWGIAGIAALVIFGVLHPVWAYANGSLFIVLILLFGLISTAKGLAQSSQ